MVDRLVSDVLISSTERPLADSTSRRCSARVVWSRNLYVSITSCSAVSPSNVVSYAGCFTDLTPRLAIGVPTLFARAAQTCGPDFGRDPPISKCVQTVMCNMAVRTERESASSPTRLRNTRSNRWCTLIATAREYPAFSFVVSEPRAVCMLFPISLSPPNTSTDPRIRSGPWAVCVQWMNGHSLEVTRQGVGRKRLALSGDYSLPSATFSVATLVGIVSCSNEMENWLKILDVAMAGVAAL